jgi:Caspase domain
MLQSSMKLVWFILLLSFASLAQVNSVEILAIPDDQSSSALSTPSFSEQSKRLCFVKRQENLEAIMISELAASGNWSKPYEAFTLSKKDLVEGITFNSNGNRIYLGLNNDIYFIDYLGGASWSVPLKIGAPISSENGEHQPSIMENELEIFFLRGVKDSNGNWVRRVFYSNKDLSWSTPKMVLFKGINFDEGELFGLRIMPTGKTCFLTTSVKPSAHNYIGQLRDSVFTDFKEINFSGGAIKWVSSDFSYGFGVTHTNPPKLIKINFTSNWFLGHQLKEEETPVQRNLVNTEMKSELVKPSGKYFGLLIGVSQYQDSKLNLEKPVRDAQQLADLLTNQYSFDKKDVTMLSNPTRQEIMSELYKLRSVITPNDNLLIFFAGHGFWDESIKQGYWWPKDAQSSNPSFWLSNSDLREQIRGINSAHTLLISDACFSGGIFKTRDAGDITKAPIDIQVLYKTKSRRAITSGNLSAVPDRSIFFEYLTNKLLANEDKFMPAQKLFYSLKTAVIHNSLNIPQEGVITEAGDEGGDFIFIRKQQ